MRPIRFFCSETLPLAPQAIAAQILQLENWPKFAGFGPLPGIHSAEFEVQTPTVVGTRIRVQNRDGSSHVEEIVEWNPRERLLLRFGDFSPPFAYLAKSMEETWEFTPVEQGVQVKRSFAIYPRAWWSWPLLWLISWLLKGAVSRHLLIMQASA